MAASRHIDKICIAVLICALLLTAVFMNGENLGIQKIEDTDAETWSGSEWFTSNDENADWDTSLAAHISLNGSDGVVSGSGAYFYDGNLIISRGGWYVLSGTLEDGYISVDAYASSKVWLLLDGVAVHCADNACLRVEQAEKVFLTLAPGSENSFTSGETYSETALADNTGGAIYAHDDLTVNGSGALTVTAGYKHGIDANDALVITGGSLTIQSREDAVHVNDSFRMKNAALTLEAGDDGIHSDTEVYIESGTVLISTCYEGIEAPSIQIAGGDVTIYPTDDGLNANGGSDVMAGGFGTGGGMPMGGFGGGRGRQGSAENSEDGETAAPVETGENPDGAAEGQMPEQDGASPESGGEKPDFGGLAEGFAANARTGGGQDLTAESTDTDSESEPEACIRISGGTLTIVNTTAQDADGLDSNGDISITGGTVLVSLVNSGSNSAMDYGSESGGVAEISGGTVIACGSHTMAESFDATSTQPSILYNFSQGVEAGTAVALEDASGNVLLSWTVPCSFSSMVMSCPEMELNGSYLVVIGDDVEEITLDEISASFGDAQSAMFGGSMNWGGMQSRDDFDGRRGGRQTEGAETGETGGADSGENPFSADGGTPPELPEDFDGSFTPGQPPEGFDEYFTPPDMAGDFGGMGQARSSGAAVADSESAAAQTSAGYDAQVWLMAGISLAILLCGITFAVLYRARRH